jgi:periplasmic divalent cation tolerance protein
MTDKLVVLSMCESQGQATQIARTLVEAELAACVNVVAGATSVYRWQGRVEEASEWMLVIKTRRTLFDAVAERIAELHSYEVPEVVALAVEAGSGSYMAWWDANTRGLPKDANTKGLPKEPL